MGHPPDAPTSPSDQRLGAGEEDEVTPLDTRHAFVTEPESGSSLAEMRRGGIELERNPVRAIHDDDLESFLRSLGLLGDQGMRTSCKFCREVVSVERVAAVFPLGGSIKVACDKPRCQSELLEAIRQREVRL